ncbi:MAG: winged helix-turn-helix transcriptional regulator [Nitrospiraceae bacterium]|nr:winged helix-turn-helix transcriptional regulator [Nitrospiraceae bacterium]
MDIFIDENSTRKNIILLLKKNGGMSIEDLSKVIEITPMGIRQHLLALEKKGIVSYVSRRRGIGRPGFIYMLTDAANDLFPKAYDKFAVDLLRDIREHEGDEKIDKIFNWRRERLVNSRKEALAGKAGIEATLNALKDMLEADGHLVEISKNSAHYHLKQFHCPINKVAREFHDACKYELQMYRELIHRNISREQSVAEGAQSCVYLIPKN